MFATQVLPETLSDDDSQDDLSEIIGYLIVREKKYEVKKGETKIGRDSSMCSIVIEDFAVSKIHAVIESEGIDDTFIYDVGSTNQTKLGKKVLKPHCRYKLDNESKLTLGNIIAKFVLHSDKSSTLETSKLNSENINPLDKLEDIFELATQVTVPDITSEITVFEKLPQHNSVLKVPTLVLPVKESPKSVFDEVTQCKLDSQETRLKTVFPNNQFDSSNIFNLNTQCQLYEVQTQESEHEEKLDNNDNNKNREGDKIKSLLNDGQDDVLCVFMSLHSPKEQLKEVKTEAEDLCEVFDAPTQIQPVIIEEPFIQSKVNQISSRLSENCLDKPSITSTPIVGRLKPNQSEISENSTQHLKEEDFIKTKEFNIEGEKTVKSFSQDEETQLYLGDTLDDLSATEQKNNDEDFILTQSFEPCESRQNTRNAIPESEDINEVEDFMATQIYDCDKEKLENAVSSTARTPPFQLECDLDETLDFTQRNSEGDFIETQVFDLRENDINSGRNVERKDSDNVEDFIATQSVEILVNKRQINKNAQESSKTTSRESSPDLLGFEDTCKNSEDLIATQMFDVPECQAKSSEQINSIIPDSCKKDHCNNSQTKELVESSGDETESDLEIILDKTETKKAEDCIKRFFKTEPEPENNSQPQNVEIEDNNSNSSYIFELGPENHVEDVNDVNEEQQRIANMSDSDETDCEEIAVFGFKHTVKQEPLEKIEETQAFTSALPDQEKTSNNALMSEELEESPNFESGIENGSKSPEVPNVETNNIILEDESGVIEDFQIPSKIKKTEVGVCKSGREVDSPLKRPLDSKGLDVVPIKKSKTEVSEKLLKSNEKKLLKLVQEHDIAQIQPSRTRNSSKKSTTGNNSNNTEISVTNENRLLSRRKSNRKKINGDITSYLETKKVETRRTSYREKVKETSPKEKKTSPNLIECSSRVLRSSRRSGNAVSPVLNERTTRNTPIRKCRRISRNDNEDYFTSSFVNVVFTGFSCESLDKIIFELGGKKSDDLSCGEVVIADKVRRTVKFLCAIGLGLPITSPEWLMSCRREQKFLNPWNFILTDEESEEKYNFRLKTSIERAKRMKLLEGFSIFATESTKPPVKELLDIVKCCGGIPILKAPDVWPKKTIIVSCLEDKQSWPSPKIRNIKLVHYEFILGGVLRQEIDFKTYKLR